MLLYFFIMSILYIPVKIILFFIVNKFGKLTYKDLNVAGFSYNKEKDIFISTKGAWQKKFGYCYMYDVTAPLCQMIIDTEPIKFNYNNKNYLITFWKGQYGITTGAEIGIYATSEKKINKKTIYLPVSDDEMLDMSFILYKKNKEITRVSSKHWWLTAFKIGEFSKPKDLSMDIKIVFKDKEMLESFLKSFKKLKQKSKNYNIIDNTFYFKFKKPKTHKVWTRFFISDLIRQSINRKNVNIYNKYLNDAFNYPTNKELELNKFISEFLKAQDENIIKDNKDSETKPKKNFIYLNENVYSNIKSDLNE